MGCQCLTELVHDAGRDGDPRGALFDLRKVLTLEPGMSPAEIWCNESQERYVLAIAPQRHSPPSRHSVSVSAAVYGAGRCRCLERFDGCRCQVQQQARLICRSRSLAQAAKMERNAPAKAAPAVSLAPSALSLRDAAYQVLQHPAVADKTFLVTIGDHFVGG